MIEPDARETTIVIRDRRQPLQFSIANAVIDDWLPIIGPVAYTVYSLYVRMAHHNDERCWPGYSLICSHLNIGHSTLSDTNKLLEWAGLIYIQPGDRITSNDYYILDIPPVSPQQIDHIRDKAQTTLAPDSHFLATLLHRLAAWRSIADLWSQHNKPTINLMRPGQPELPGLDEQGAPPPEQGTPVPEHPTPPPEHPTPPPEHTVRQQERNNPKEQSERTIRRNREQQHAHPSPADVDVALHLLNQTGIVDPARTKIANSCSLQHIRAWLLYSAKRELRNPAGFLVAQLLSRTEPPDPYMRLATIPADAWSWLDTHAQSRQWNGDWPEDPPIPEDLADLWYKTTHPQETQQTEPLLVNR